MMINRVQFCRNKLFFKHYISAKYHVNIVLTEIMGSTYIVYVENKSKKRCNMRHVQKSIIIEIVTCRNDRL